MNFELRNGKEHLPDEEDMYGVNDAEERERFDALFGAPTQEERLRRRRSRLRIIAGLVIIVIAIGLIVALHRTLGW